MSIVADIFATRTVSALADLLSRRESDPGRLEQVAELYLEVIGMDAGHVVAAIAGNEASAMIFDNLTSVQKKEFPPGSSGCPAGAGERGCHRGVSACRRSGDGIPQVGDRAGRRRR